MQSDSMNALELTDYVDRFVVNRFKNLDGVADVSVNGERRSTIELPTTGLRNGYGPIVAHPEVTPFLWREPDLIDRLVEAGALLQVTAMSVTGDFGRAVRDRVWSLLEDDLVHFVASDAHRPDWRPPGLARAHALLTARLGLATAQRLTVSNPLAVVEDRPLESQAEEEVG